MMRSIRRAALLVLVVGTLDAPASGAELKPLHTATAQDVTVTVLSESGHWVAGSNSLVLEFASATTKQPLDVGRVTLTASMVMRGMASMRMSATITPDPGRYLSTITFPHPGVHDLTIAWDGPAGKNSSRFPVLVGRPLDDERMVGARPSTTSSLPETFSRTAAPLGCRGSADHALRVATISSSGLCAGIVWVFAATVAD